MSKQRNAKPVHSVGERLIEEARRLRTKAETALSVDEQKDLLNRARTSELSGEIEDWLNSPGLKPPK